MQDSLLKTLSQSLKFCLVLSLLTGIVYPLLVSALAQTFFKQQADGSLILHNGQVIGSSLIGQPFHSAAYFWGRPSATPEYPYNAAHSAASNLALSNPLFLQQVKQRLERFKNTEIFSPVPYDLVSASASGLDPDISPLAALYQVERVAAARKLPAGRLYELVQQQILEPDWGLFGEARVNVLHLNLALDAYAQRALHRKAHD